MSVGFQGEKIVFWNTNRGVEIDQQAFIDPDTYIILKRLPAQVPPEMVHACGSGVGAEERIKVKDASQAVMEKIIHFSERKKLKAEESLFKSVHLPLPK